MHPMIKCLVWDLDDTLWQGTLKEDETGIELLPGIKNVLDTLDRRGIVQSIASRNNWEQVKSKLEELGVGHYFLYPQCHFDSKALSMERIAKELNIGLDSLALIDNDPFERFEINYYVPQIRTYDARQYRDLPEYPEFQNSHATEESVNRRQYMQARSRREEASKEYKGSREQFLKECGMKLGIRLAQEEDYPRVVELSHRTNQMNSLLERIDMPFVDSYCKQDGRYLYVAKLEDRFGAHGLIGTCFVNTAGAEINLDLFCISCRIEGRGIASAFLYTVLERLGQQHPMAETVRCRLVRKERNLPARLLLEMLGFKKTAADDMESTYILQLPIPHKVFTWLEIGE
ncbi:HAD family hydrolase [Paenibacillus sp. UNC499MF]|uniref:HAD-IIIC family phosphatase n=1 Tax=Paenibacillus sp. UNC499MF TaxID=1502751 RepID=UPI00089FED60|nr:HAD-IIIC family phosphatase [Paenibacillus sp. UNC499MF]SEG59125.1 HAD-superfamily phosphatase, subfamily IIIC/FkbH-like domain-containing protein [Paenibacillus sp. UNC499MF]